MPLIDIRELYTITMLVVLRNTADFAGEQTRFLFFTIDIRYYPYNKLGITSNISFILTVLFNAMLCYVPDFLSLVLLIDAF